jgi:hypothetical protein
MSSDLEQRCADRLAVSSAKENQAQRVALEATARALAAQTAAAAAQNAAAIASAKASSLGAEATTLGASALAMKETNSEYNAQELEILT